jgi:D-alanyl-D-alanine carboxypeptidase
MDDPAALQTHLEEWWKNSATLGVTAAVRIDGQLCWQGASGLLNPDKQQALPIGRRFCIYSLTKSFTAVCILRLQAHGAFQTADSMKRWFPDLPLPDSITLAHLLRHTSGLRDYGPLQEYHDSVKCSPSHPWTEEQFLDSVVPRGLLFEPGNGWAYSNVGFMLLRNVIEKVTGGTYRKSVEEQVVKPLGLKNTFVAETIGDWASCVPGYGKEVSASSEAVDVRGVYHPGWCAPGVMISTTEEITQFYDALITGQLVDAEALREMLTMVRVPGHHPPAVTPSSGMGIFGDPDSPVGASYGHGGGGPGYNLDASIVPRSSRGRVALAVFCNSSYGQMARDAERALLSLMLKTTP